MSEADQQTTRAELRGDCSSCFGLCCAALPFAKSADFAITKAAGTPCPNLEPTFGCGIHATLRPSGFRGCTVYDCFGAGQHVAQVTYSGVSWREAPATMTEMFEVFPIVRHLHELLWYLADALAREVTVALHADLRAASQRTWDLAGSRPEVLADLDRKSVV